MTAVEDVPFVFDLLAKSSLVFVSAISVLSFDDGVLFKRERRSKAAAAAATDDEEAVVDEDGFEDVVVLAVEVEVVVAGLVEVVELALTFTLDVEEFVEELEDKDDDEEDKEEEDGNVGCCNTGNCKIGDI